MRQHDVAKPLYCRAGRGSAAITERQRALFANALCSLFMVNAALRRSRQSMIRKGGYRHSGKIMLERQAKANCRINLKIFSL
jgi:hypothetical protein